jgi:CheY-like chemotaxis protein
VAGKFALDAHLMDPATVVSAAVESIQPVAVGRHVRLETEIGPVARVLGDAGRLQQAVWNLLSNAIKFTPRGGRVEVLVQTAGADVEILVRDNGCGISPEALPVIFDRLQQGGDDATRRQGGLGLGLAIVRQVVELHGGTVDAQSPGVGLGASFRILLPAARVTTTDLDRRLPRVLTGSTAPNAAIRDLGILVVEDADDARQLLHDFLASQGAAVTAVGSAEAALDWLQHHRPEVIISDIEMPGQTGLEFIRYVRSHLPDLGLTPAIALTAYGAPDDRDRSFLAGFQTHLTKPVDLTELAETVTALCRGPIEREAAVVMRSSS